MRTNQEYKNSALARLDGHWTPAVLATLVYLLIVIVFAGAYEVPGILNPAMPTSPESMSFILGLGGVSLLVGIFIFYPLEVGYTNAMRVFYERRDDEAVRNLFDFAKSNYLHKVWGMFLMNLKVFLWTLLFIIPGIVMAFAYAMTPYILEEHPEISAWEASTRSRAMMRGHKFDLFSLYLSFIGWALLAILTAGIGFLWLAPYASSSVAAFYNDLKEEQGEVAVTE